MFRLVTIVVMSMVAWMSMPAFADDTDEDTTADHRPNLWDKTERVESEAFIHEVVPTDTTLLEPGPGPWEIHPLDTPVSAGPWRIDRPGAAPTHVDRDGSAREPPPPAAQWGPPTGDDGKVEMYDPWADGKAEVARPSGTGPLSDNFPIRILGHEPDALLIELPLLVAESPNDFDGAGFWVIVEIFVDRKKVGDHRQLVSPQTIAAMGPTHAWIKALVPIPAPQGKLELRVSRISADGQTVEALFIRSLRYGR
jgi:hypothetical protein